jgi:hypothetical protein
VNTSFGRVWDAVIDVFAERNIPIKTIDRSSGLIVTEQLSVSPGTLSGAADCGTLMGQLRTPTAANYNVLVRGDSTRAVVKVTPRFINVEITPAPYATPTTIECSSTGAWESGVEQRIQAIAEGHDVRPVPSRTPAGCTESDAARRVGKDWHVTLNQVEAGTCRPVSCTIRGVADRGTPEDAIALCRLDHSLWDRPNG